MLALGSGAATKLTPAANFADRIAEIIRSEVDQGRAAPGARLPTEGALASSFGVSRTVIREALSALRREGVIESFQGKGIFVAEPSRSFTFKIGPLDLGDVQEILSTLEFITSNEVAAAGIAARRRTIPQLEAIELALVEMDQALVGDGDGVEGDVRFHSAIAEATNNPLFVSFNAFLEKRLRVLIRVGRESNARFGVTKASHDEHRAVFDAIAAGDRDAAVHAAEAHFRNVEARLREHFPSWQQRA